MSSYFPLPVMLPTAAKLLSKKTDEDITFKDASVDVAAHCSNCCADDARVNGQPMSEGGNHAHVEAGDPARQLTTKLYGIVIPSEAEEPLP
jgi:hypothetical protein